MGCDAQLTGTQNGRGKDQGCKCPGGISGGKMSGKIVRGMFGVSCHPPSSGEGKSPGNVQGQSVRWESFILVGILRGNVRWKRP